MSSVLPEWAQNTLGIAVFAGIFIYGFILTSAGRSKKSDNNGSNNGANASNSTPNNSAGSTEKPKGVGLPFKKK